MTCSTFALRLEFNMSGEVTLPRVYVIVVNYNGWRDTIECLESLLRSDYPSLTVLVCDNASTDGSLDHIRSWADGNLPATPTGDRMAHMTSPPLPKPVSLTRLARHEFEALPFAPDSHRGTGLVLVDCESNLGFAGANNVALQWTLGREKDALALLLNNDVIIAPGAVRAMVDVATSAPDVGAVGATILRYHDPDRVETLAGARLSRKHGMTTMVSAGADR